MPKRAPLGVLTDVRLVRMDSKAVERGEPDLWQITVEGYMVGHPCSLDHARYIKAWFGLGALRDITNLCREGGSSNG